MSGFLILPAYFTLILQKGSIDWDVIITIYSIPSVARTRMAGLPWMIRTLFFSPYKILPVVQEKKYLGMSSYFIMELYVVCTH